MILGAGALASLLLFGTAASASTPRVRFQIAPEAEKLPSLEQRLLAAFRFDTTLGAIPEEAQPAVIHVRLAALDGAVAEATGPDRLTIDPRAFSRDDADGTLAHELSHVLDLEALGAHAQAFPRYLHEGKALEAGFRYRKSLGAIAADDHARAAIARRISASEAAGLIAHFRTGADRAWAHQHHALGRAMTVGLLFVEFLRVHRLWKAGGQVMPALSRICLELGQGAAAEQAFRAEFQAPLETLEKDFIEFLRSTETAPAERVRGTIFEDL